MNLPLHRKRVSEAHSRRSRSCTRLRRGGRFILHPSAFILLPLLLLSSLLVLGGCDLIGGIFDDDDSSGDSQSDSVRGPILWSVGPHTALIRGREDQAAVVEVDLPSGVTSELTEGENGEYEFRLSSLDPGTDYWYQLIVDSQDKGPRREFRTPELSPTSARFAVYGDSRSNTQVHNSIAEMIEGWVPDFVVHVGDFVDDDNTRGWDAQWFSVADDLFSQYPLYAAMGNHEEGSSIFANWLSRGDASDLDGTYYSFSYGPTFFVVFNTTLPIGEGSEQFTWMEAELASSAAQEAEWRIGVTHYPPYSSTDKDDLPEAFVQDVIPVFKQNGVRVLFAGHAHVYERLEDDDLTVVISGGGGAGLHELDQRRTNSVAFAEEYHACIVNATPSEFYLRAQTPEGDVLDEVTLR